MLVSVSVSVSVVLSAIIYDGDMVVGGQSNVTTASGSLRQGLPARGNEPMASLVRCWLLGLSRSPVARFYFFSVPAVQVY